MFLNFHVLEDRLPVGEMMMLVQLLLQLSFGEVMLLNLLQQLYVGEIELVQLSHCCLLDGW